MKNDLVARFFVVAIAAGYSATADARERRYQMADRDLETLALAPNEIINSPNWADHRIYPTSARLRHQEGNTVFQLTVGADGIPNQCVIVESSGYVELDDGTCDLGMTIRFAPPGQSAIFRQPLVWRLSNPTTFGVGRTTVRVDLADGTMRDCATSAEGRVPLVMNAGACELISGQLVYFFGEHPDLTAATVVLELLPTGQEPAPASSILGTPFALRRTRFRLTRGGEPIGCELIEERGFGRLSHNYARECGFFLAQMWIRPARRAEPSGTFQISVYANEPADDTR